MLSLKMLFGVLLTLSTLPLAVHAKCVSLKVMGSGLYTANKAISAPALGISGNNWNTDFIVPSRSYRRYVAKVKTDKNGQYDMKMILKYPDGTSKTYFEQSGRPMGVNATFTMTAKPPKGSRPYQVNVLTGGTTVLGNGITQRVYACT